MARARADKRAPGRRGPFKGEGKARRGGSGGEARPRARSLHAAAFKKGGGEWEVGRRRRRKAQRANMADVAESPPPEPPFLPSLPPSDPSRAFLLSSGQAGSGGLLTSGGVRFRSSRWMRFFMSMAAGAGAPAGAGEARRERWAVSQPGTAASAPSSSFAAGGVAACARAVRRRRWASASLSRAGATD